MLDYVLYASLWIDSSRTRILMDFQDYFSASSQLHRTQISALLSLYGAAVKKGLDEEGDQGEGSRRNWDRVGS